jgi:hypothetical protein
MSEWFIHGKNSIRVFCPADLQPWQHMVSRVTDVTFSAKHKEKFLGDAHSLTRAAM